MSEPVDASAPLTGGCLCGDVRYAIAAPVRMMGHCHCSRCRRWTGGRYSTEVTVLREQVRLTAGARTVRVTYVSGIGPRTFCRRCGSCLVFGDAAQEDRPFLGVLAGTLDDACFATCDLRPMSHIYVSSKAPWETIPNDGLPKIVEEAMGEMLAPDDVGPLAAAAAPDPPGAARPLEGGCLCGGVRYALTGPFVRANHCHCTRCRTHSGTYGLTQGRVRREHFALLRGAGLLTTYAEPGHAAKVFCAQCGSSVFGGAWPAGETVSVRLGTLDGDAGVRPQFHTFVGEKAVWDAIADDLPQFAGRATREDMTRLGLV